MKRCNHCNKENTGFLLICRECYTELKQQVQQTWPVATEANYSAPAQTNFDNWKAGLTVENMGPVSLALNCEDCPARDYCDSVYMEYGCYGTFKRWADSEYIQQPEEWKPKLGERYRLVNSNGAISSCDWEDHAFDFSNYAMGNCFPTEEAAKAGKPDVLAKFEAIRREVVG